MAAEAREWLSKANLNRSPRYSFRTGDPRIATNGWFGGRFRVCSGVLAGIGTQEDRSGGRKRPQKDGTGHELAVRFRIGGMEIIPDKRKVVGLVEQVHEGKICLPNFQRDFVWTREEVADLVRSIIRGYFIGSLLLLRCDPNNPPFAPEFLRGAQASYKEPQPELRRAQVQEWRDRAGEVGGMLRVHRLETALELARRHGCNAEVY
jgi:Protein of unknown function DUF262